MAKSNFTDFKIQYFHLQQNLTHDDTYIYLQSIMGLAECSNYNPDSVNMFAKMSMVLNIHLVFKKTKPLFYFVVLEFLFGIQTQKIL